MQVGYINDASRLGYILRPLVQVSGLGKGGMRGQS